MSTILEAAADAQLNYRSVKQSNPFTSDVEDIQASTVVGGCVCRGKCGTHTGPCTMKAGKGVIGGKMCKACSMAGKGKKK
jgi:hypothetical protein